ncbi:MAG: methyltransferase domain-containing protein [Candidatus Binatia bacterium]
MPSIRLLVPMLALLAACTQPALRPDEDRRPYHAHHRFEHAEDWVARFEDPARDPWQKPDDVIRTLALAPSASVADIGAGTGYFSVRFARAVPEGRVFAIDVEPSMVEYVTERAKRDGLANIDGVLASPDDPHIPAPVDLIVVVDTYHHLTDRSAYFRRLRRALRPAGRIAIIDFKPESKMGPIEKVALAQVIRELAEAGYALVEQPTMLPEQYFLIFGVAPAE